MRIALTGSSGLIGHAIAAELQRAGHTLVRIGRAAASDVAFDLEQPRVLERAELSGCDALVHAAGVIDEDFRGVGRERANAKALAGPQAMLDAAAGAQVRRFVYVSSAHVYGALEGRIDESHPLAPISEYARSHVATEELFARAAAPQSAALLLARPCAVYGRPPDLARFTRWSLIPFDFPRQALGGTITLKSPGLQQRNFVAADSVAAGVAAWLDRPTPGITAANMPGAETLSVYDFALRCARLAEGETGVRCEVVRPPLQGAAPAPLSYLTLGTAPPPSESLDNHLRAMVRALSR